MRYRLSKLKDATEEFLHSVFQADRYKAGRLPGGGGGDDDDRASSSGGAAGASGGGGGVGGVVRSAYRRALEVYEQPLTERLMITGPAMAPTINRHGIKDPAARELLVVRLLRHPSPRNVLVGDVVAFHSPLATLDDTHHVMVRRVAAVEGQEMVSSSDAEPPFVIPAGHCWVLADNAHLRPEDGEVIDSRSYGHIPYSNVIGRVVYAAASRHDHRPVPNNPEHGSEGALLGAGEDEAVVAAELDVDALFEDEEEGEDEEEEGEEEEEEQVEGEDEEDRERARRKRERERQAQQPDPAARLRRHEEEAEAAAAAGRQQQQQSGGKEAAAGGPEGGAGGSGQQGPAGAPGAAGRGGEAGPGADGVGPGATPGAGGGAGAGGAEAGKGKPQ
ncbi:hypothetical protein HXX76_003089 [Chlamydomonas incerta]|uniref:Mitochondrial inner membrane protease subunit 2 n=1 Tax=Chlamydomonas incerta TaxID=51695 RepID=A0A835TD40_CHLIN|nr:hypothetical protein HXX76_003089 [Chlamydomonas incerta]|eukprot:KAG2441467.1 hypothetical protein HXX76_003089 [Chlamydomonas incerta]